MDNAEKLARVILECTEEVGKGMVAASGGLVRGPVFDSDTWTYDTLPEHERRGLYLSAKMLLERGYVTWTG